MGFAIMDAIRRSVSRRSHSVAQRRSEATLAIEPLEERCLLSGSTVEVVTDKAVVAEGGHSGWVYFVRDEAPDEPVSVAFKITGDAVAGEDYEIADTVDLEEEGGVHRIVISARSSPFEKRP